MTLTRIAALSMAALAVAACGTAPDDDALVELDHVFVVVPDPLGAVATLTEAGLTVDTSMVARHDGNGTASFAAAFDNAYLEILWVEPTVPVADESEDELALRREASEWRPDGPSPFGIGLRRTRGDITEFPFRGSEREIGEWVEDGELFFVFDTESDEPAAFVVPEYMGMSNWGPQMRQQMPGLFEHPLGVGELTSVRLHTSSAPGSVQDAGLPFIHFGDAAEAPLLELEFDGGRAGAEIDLRPDLPLLLRR